MQPQRPFLLEFETNRFVRAATALCGVIIDLEMEWVPIDPPRQLYGHNIITTPSGALSMAHEQERQHLFGLVGDLTNAERRESALLELSKRRDRFPDLAPILWHSPGTIAALLHEIVSIYPHLAPASLSTHASNRVCNALALLQCVASHAETRSQFMAGPYSGARLNVPCTAHGRRPRTVDAQPTSRIIFSRSWGPRARTNPLSTSA